MKGKAATNTEILRIKQREEGLKRANRAALLSDPFIDKKEIKSTFNEYIDNLNKSLNATTLLENATVSAFKNMEDALVNYVMTGKTNFKDLATVAIAEINRIVLRSTIIKPFADIFKDTNFSGAFKTLFSGGDSGNFDPLSLISFANGGVVSGKSINQYSNQVVSAPTIVPHPNVQTFASGGALFGEAGPEAIMPLTRTSGGDLGVKVDTTDQEAVTNIYIQAVDAESFSEMVNNNPGAIVAVVNKAMKSNTSLRNTMRRTI